MSTTFGLEVYNASSQTLITLTDRLARFVQTGTIVTATATESVTVSVPGMQNNDSWNVFILSWPGLVGAYSYEITKNTGSFTLQRGNINYGTLEYVYWVARS